MSTPRHFELYPFVSDGLTPGSDLEHAIVWTLDNTPHPVSDVDDRGLVDGQRLTSCGQKCDPTQDYCMVQEQAVQIGRKLDQASDETLRGLSQIVCMSLVDYASNTQQIERDSTIDPMTGLLKRETAEDVFSARLSQLYTEARYQPYGTVGVYIAFIDLDGFKAVNDGVGHPKGDELLGIVGNKLMSSLRKNDLIARWGGDEFVVAGLLTKDEETDETDCFDANLFGQRILDALTFDFVTENEEGEIVSYPIAASIGVVSLTEPALTGALGPDRHLCKDYVRAADSAMYEAKRGGKRQVRVAC